MGVKLGFLWIFKGHNHGDNHQFKWLAVFPIGLQRPQPKKKWRSCTNCSLRSFPVLWIISQNTLFFPPLSVILHVNRTLHIVSRTKKFKIWRLGKLASLSFPFHVFILYHLSRQQTQKILQSSILPLPSNIDKNGGSKWW